MKATIAGILVGLMMVGCAAMTKQDQEFAAQFLVMRSLEASSQPAVRAEQILIAVHVVEGAIRPGAGQMAVDHLLLQVDEWVNGQDWLASDKHAAKYIVRRVVESHSDGYDLTIPIDDALRAQIEAGMQSIRDAVALSGFGDP